MRSFLKNCISWICAAACAFSCVNLLCMVYYHPTDEIASSGQASVGLKYPNDWGIYGNEGLAFSRVDDNGLINRSKLPDKNFVLAMGSSHTEGFAVGTNKRWTDILSREYHIPTYNTAHSGYLLDSIIPRFNAIVQDFPGASAVVLETPILNYSEDNLREAMEQTVLTPETSHEAVINNLSQTKQLRHSIKSALPLLRLLRLQYLIATQGSVDATTWSSNQVASEQTYTEALAQIRNCFDGQIVIVFLPSMEIRADGTLSFGEQETVSMFARSCEANQIDFLDMTPYFRDAYAEHYIAATGFWNTTMGSGHINAHAHRMVADALATLMEA